MVDLIPAPELTSWMHDRLHLTRESKEARKTRYRRQPRYIQAVDAVLSRIFTWGRLLGPSMRPTTYKIISRYFYLQFRLQNRLKILGKENIPKNGCIFYINHPGQMDPSLLVAASPVQLGGLVAWGHGWFMDMLENIFGFLSLRKSTANEMVERMIRQLWKKNRYFAIWPEGHPTYSQNIEQGHSSIIRVYAVLNNDRNRIPFVPVLLRGAKCYRIKEPFWAKDQPKKPKNSPIEVHFFPPIYFDRKWLQPPAKGGKTPRELIDFLMNHLAKKRGQKSLFPNKLLEWRRENHVKRSLEKKA